MGKITFHRTDGDVEVEVSDGEVSNVLRVILEYPQPEKHSTSSEVLPINDKKISKTNPKLSGRLVHSKLILETRTELRGRDTEGQSTYQIYQDPLSSEYIGVVTTPNRRHSINLGNFDNPSSAMYIISKAVNAMQIDKPFSKSDLQRVLPEKEGKGNKMKFVLDYLEVIAKVIEKMKGKQLRTNAMLYKRIRTLGETSGENVVQSHPEATLNTTT